MMTPDQFRAGIERLWGYGAQTKAASHFDVASRQVRRWLSGENGIPEGVAAQLHELLSVAPPPDSTADQDRDDACVEAIEPRMSEMVEMAESAGWHRAEIQAAALTLTVNDILHTAGADAVEEILSQALDGVRGLSR